MHTYPNSVQALSHSWTLSSLNCPAAVHPWPLSQSWRPMLQPESAMQIVQVDQNQHIRHGNYKVKAIKLTFFITSSPKTKHLDIVWSVSSSFCKLSGLYYQRNFSIFSPFVRALSSWSNLIYLHSHGWAVVMAMKVEARAMKRMNPLVEKVFML